MRQVPARPPRSREYLAALATAAVLAQLLLFQLTLVTAVVLAVAGRLTRWRPHWLAVPGGAGLAWALAAPRRAVSGYVAAAGRLVAYLSAPGSTAPGGHHGLPGLIGSLVHDLPGQLPLALLGGAAEAGGLMWLRGGSRGSLPFASSSRTRGDRGANWRPGLIATSRRAAAVRALSAGRTVTVAGAAVGVASTTGRRAELTWAEAERAVLVCGADAAALADVCLPAVCAAMRRRMAVVIACPEGEVVQARRAAAIATSLGIEIADLTGLCAAEDPARLRAALGQLIRRREVALTPAAGVTATELGGALAALRDLALRGDTLAWIHCCEHAGEASLRELIALGRDTGTRLLLSTASRATAAALAGAVEVVIAAGPVGPDEAVELADSAAENGGQGAARAIESQPAGAFAIVAPRLLARCVAVPLLAAVPRGPGPTERSERPGRPGRPGRSAPTGRSGPTELEGRA
jgi:hypothetical protein